ncbi:MAG: ABC transporter substrate-binding protein, partial [Gammaproteobacteria bacterium]|nr:ABC transporter substrate-binding protein [Gammaproteobacteria bacterium]
MFISLVAFSFGCDKGPDKPLTIAMNEWTGYQPLVYAHSMGYLNPNQVHLATLGSTSASLIQFRAGNADAITVTLDEALLLNSEGYDISIVLIMDISNGGDAIVSKPQIKTIHQLKGKRIAVENTAVGAYVLTRALQQANMSLSDIHPVPLSADKHINLFKLEDIDAVVTFEPTKTELNTQGGHIVFDSSMIPNEIIDVLVINNAKLKTYRDELEHVIDAW